MDCGKAFSYYYYYYYYYYYDYYDLYAPQRLSFLPYIGGLNDV